MIAQLDGCSLSLRARQAPAKLHTSECRVAPVVQDLDTSERNPMGEMILLTTFVGMVSVTTRMLYRHPIRWSEEMPGAHADPTVRRARETWTLLGS